MNAYSFSLGAKMEKYFDLGRAYYTYLKNEALKNIWEKKAEAFYNLVKISKI